jgi:hypothetical protein
MKSRVLWGLVGLNAVLMLMLVGHNKTANAQVQMSRHPADYLMIPGEVQGGATELVYLVDTTNGLLGAISYDDTSKNLQMMPSINLNTLFNPPPPPSPLPPRR